MTVSDYREPARSGGSAWILAPIILIMFLGLAMSVGVYAFGEPQLTIAESIAAGFGGLAAIIFGLLAAAFGILAGLLGALIGLIAAGGAVALTLFIVGSPIIAIILIVLLMRRPREQCPDPEAHR